MMLHLEDVRPRDVLDSTMPLMAMQAAEKCLELRDETVNTNLPLVRADEVRMRQVLLNLLSNALKFTPKGRVTLRADLASHPGFLRLEVEDTGIGIPEDKREAVFLKFVQVDAAQSRRHGGSGLGLPIARKLVELMGGAIGIESGAGGRGTRIWFTLPLTMGAVEPASGGASDRSAPATSRREASG